MCHSKTHNNAAVAIIMGEEQRGLPFPAVWAVRVPSFANCVLARVPATAKGLKAEGP